MRVGVPAGAVVFALFMLMGMGMAGVRHRLAVGGHGWAGEGGGMILAALGTQGKSCGGHRGMFLS